MKKTLLAALGFSMLAAPALADPVQIKFAYPSAPNNALFQAMQGWTDDVNKAADGAIEVKLFPGGVIADNTNMYDRVTGGVADIGFAVFGPVSSVFPKTNVGTLPFEAKDHREDALALWALYEKGVIRDEFTKFHPLAFIVFPGLVIHSKKPIHTLADVTGMKISVEGRVLSEMIPRLGAAPISLTPGELYQSLQRGLVEAVPQGWPSVPTFHLNEVTTFHLEAPLRTLFDQVIGPNAVAFRPSTHVSNWLADTTGTPRACADATMAWEPGCTAVSVCMLATKAP